MAFADIFELSDYLGRTVATTEEARAALLLDSATAIIKAYTGQEIEAGTATETFTWGQVVRLRQFPVTDVVMVDVDGSVKDPDTYTFDSSGMLRWVDWSTPITNLSTGWIVTVEYDYGYDPVPADVKAVCLSVAGRAFLRDPSGIEREQIGTYVVQYSTAGAGGRGLELTDGEKGILAPYTSFVAA